MRMYILKHIHIYIYMYAKLPEAGLLLRNLM